MVFVVNFIDYFHRIISKLLRYKNQNLFIRLLQNILFRINQAEINQIRRKTIETILIQKPPYNCKYHKQFLSNLDPIRSSTIALAINTIKNEKVLGSFAEVGVYKGATSKILHTIAPERKLYLFDTFEGFPEEFLEKEEDEYRFKTTNLEILKKTIGDFNNIIIKKGIFPDTTIGLESERFALVILDVDLYKSTLEGLKFFYERVSKGGYIFIHDYNNPDESNAGVLRAVKVFMENKPEKFVELSDRWGSIVLRKL